MAVNLRADIAALAPYRQGRAAADDAYKLSSNENPNPTHPAILAAIAESNLNRYPDGAATLLRARLAERAGVSVDEVHVGAGSASILLQLFQAAAGTDDEIVYPWRSFEAYPLFVTISGATGVPVPNLPGGHHDLDGMAEAITERTRVVVICSPNNPTSTLVTAAAFREFMAKVPPTVLVLLDEAYYEFVTDPHAVDGLKELENHPNLVVLRTFSKAFGLAGLRVGWAVGASYILDAARSAAIPLSVIEPAQRAALAALDIEHELLAGVDDLIARRAQVFEGLTAAGWTVPEPHGNFVWFAAGDETTAVANVLEDDGIIGRIFAGDGIRISIGEEGSVERLLRSAARVVETLPQAVENARLG